VSRSVTPTDLAVGVSVAADGQAGRPLLVNIERAAEILAISRTSVYQLVWRDELVPIHIGRSVRFSIAQLEDFVSSRSAAG
jgi:excisionase family DNA binding protein